MKFDVHVSSALVLCAFGCIGTASEYEDDPLASNTEALSADESCDTVSANKTTVSMPGNWVTGDSYGTTGCHKAYRLNANGYVGLNLVNSPNEVHVLGYGDLVPTSKTECEKLRFGLYVWEKLPGGGTRYIGAKWKWGTWSGFCRVPEITPVLDLDVPSIEEPGRVQVHENYRFAMSARRYSTAKNSSSSYVLRKIRSRVEDF